MLIGYARTSTADQAAGFEAQLRDLKVAGCEKVFAEQLSSVDVANRAELARAIEFAREGDTLVVTKLDRLARSVAHLLDLVDALEAKGVALRILGMAIDTGAPNGRLMLNVFGSVAQFEREIMLERQREGIATANATGKHRGRGPMTCYGSFIQPRPEPGGHLRLSARFEQSPGARNFHRVQRDGRLRRSGAGRSLRVSGNRGPSGAWRCCSR